MDEKDKTPQNKEEKMQNLDLQKKCEEYENDVQRLAAEFDNYKKRIDKQSQVLRQLGREDVLIELLTLSDEFSQALEHSKTDKDARHGLELLAKKLNSTISSFDVEEVKCDGEPNPNLHEVMLQVPGKKEGTICEVLRKGYKIGERLLRPAQVSVYLGEQDEKNDDTKKKTNDRPSDSSKDGEDGYKN